MLFAIPALVIALIFALDALQGVGHVAVLLITPSSALTILVLILLLGFWRLLAIADSMLGLGAREPWRRGTTSITFTALAVLVLIMHLTVAYGAWAFYDAGSRIF